MATERDINSTIRSLLLNNEAFEYAHLIKFERPQLPGANNIFSTNANRFSYITDASRDISFNDGSTNDVGSANGSQIYRANKLLNISGYKESVQAKADTMTLTLASEVLGTTVSANLTFASNTITTNTVGVDFVEEGLKEGDKIKLEANDGSGSNHNKHFLITGFSNSNQSIAIETLDDSFTTNSTGELYNVSIESEEIKGPLLARGTDLANPSFLNKNVEVHKVFLDPETGQIKGNASILIFKGLITKANITENPERSSRVQWTLSSHWADFNKVQGRMTSDEIHRALNASGTPQRDAALKKEYADDMGFMHADTSVNLVATYKEKYQEMEVKTSKHGLFGLKTKVQTKMVDKTRDRDVDLKVDLVSKYLPVVYGVRRLPGIPVFADTPSNDPDTIYVLYAIAEGEVEAIYDIYIDGEPLVCLNKEDADARTVTGSNAESSGVLCAGRADRGETIAGNSGYAATTSDYATGKQSKFYEQEREYGTGYYDGYDVQEVDYQDAAGVYYDYYNTGSSTSYTGSTQNTVGLRDGETFSISVPMNMKFWFHSGKHDQVANSKLIQIAEGTKFKRQLDYFNSTDGQEYWSTNHRLLDTAYVLAEITVNEENTDIPELEFVVRGRIHEGYNYDFTYRHDDKGYSSENISNFTLGESVTFYRTSDDTALNTTTIRDVFEETDPRTGVVHNKIRFADRPYHASNFAYTDATPTHTEFYAKDSSNNTWHMLTWNHNDIDSDDSALPNQGSNISSLARNSSSGKLEVSVGDTDLSGQTKFKVVGTGGGQLDGIENSTFTGTYSNQVVTLDLYVATLTGSDVISNGRLIGSKQIKLPSSASATDDFYNDQFIEITSGQGVGEKRRITDYNGTTKIATLKTNFIDHPNASSNYKVYGRGSDLRSGNNPALHTLDYLTNGTFGKGLELEKDIALNTFTNSARTCDSRSDITLATTTSPTVGDEYILTDDGTASGNIIARGKVKSSTLNVTHYSVVLEDVIGQFQRIYQKWIYYKVGDIIYTNGGDLFRVPSSKGNGYIDVQPTNGSRQGLSAINNVTLYKATNTGVTLTTFGKKYVENYSLYDSDFVQYWRWVGWEHDHQRWCTRHQMNSIIETSSSVFQNTTNMLEHYNGILSYSNGNYELEVEAQEDAPSNDTPYHIKYGDIIGSLKVTEDPSRKSFNTINATLSDPGNKWSNTSVAFYNSNFVKADRNVVKTGNLQFSGITNYWNGRINAERFLTESRFPLQISFVMMPKGIILKAGQVLKIDYDRFGWSGKLFRIQDLSINPDCLVTVSAVEYDDSMYLISNTRTSALSSTQNPGAAGTGTPTAPTSLTGTTDKQGVSILTWSNASNFINSSDSTEIWASNDNNRSNAEKIGEADNETSFNHALGEEAAKYYWIRHKRVISKRRSKQKTTIFSAYHPSGATSGVPGTAKSPAQITVNLTNPSMTLQQTNTGSINYAATGTDIQVILGENILINDQSGSQANSSFRVAVSASNITAGSESTVNDANSNATIFRIGNHGNATSDTPVITYTITVKDGVGSTTTLQRFQHFAVAQDGAPGDDGFTITGTNTNHTFTGNTTGAASATGFSCDFVIREGATTWTYDGSSPYSSNSYRYGSLTDSNVSSSVASDGTITIASNSALLSGTSTVTGSIIVPIYDNSDDTLLTTAVISLNKTIEGLDGQDAKSVRLSASSLVFTEAKNGTLSPSSITLTANRQNVSSSSSFSTSPSVTLTGSGDTRALSSANFGTNDSVTVTVTADTVSDTVTLVRVEEGSDALTIVNSNPAHTVPATNTGVVNSGNLTGSGTTIKVFEGATALDYDGSGATAGHWTVSASQSPSSTLSTTSISDSGNDAVVANYTSMATGTDNVVVTYTITGKRLNGESFSLQTSQSIAKSKTGTAGGAGVRGGSIFTFEESTTSGISASDASDFAGTLDTGTAQAVAAAVIAAASDGTIRPNDRITVTDNSADKAGTRIYTGSATTSSGSVGTSDYSSLVVETFNGSVIVDGTLSASKLAADTTLTNNLNVGSNMKLSSGGKFFSQNKTSFTDTDAGFYMDTTGDFHAGDSASFIKFDASAGTVAIKADTIEFSSGTSVSTFDGVYSSLTGLPSLFDGDYDSLSNLPSLFSGLYEDLSGSPTFGNFIYNDGAGNTTTFSPTGSNVTLTRAGLNITSTYIEDTVGVGSLVGFGNTTISGGRITLTATNMNFNTQSSGGAQNLSSGGIEMNAFTQQIIISDSS